MKNLFIRLAMLTLMFVLAAGLGGCSAPTSIQIAQRPRTVVADDGFALVTSRLESVGAKAKPPRALLLYVQGAGTQSADSHVDALAGAVTMNMEVILTERRGVVANGGVDADTFNQFDTKARQVADLRAVMDHYIRETGGTGGTLPVILMGESEGGAIAAAVAGEDSRVTHLVLIGSGGGWSPAREMEFFVTKRGEYQGVTSLDDLHAQFDRIKADPDGLSEWNDHSYRHWNSVLWSPPVSDLQKVNIPIFLAHGDHDEAIPVESARALVADLQRQGKTNVTYREYHDVTHAMTDRITKASIRPLLELDLLKWFNKQGLITAQELATFSDRVKAAHPEWFGP